MKKLISIFLSLALIKTLAIPLYARESDGIKSLAKVPTVEKLESFDKARTMDKPIVLKKEETIDKFEVFDRNKTIYENKNLVSSNVKLRKESGQVFLSGKLSQKQIAGEKSATKFLEENKHIFGMESTSEDLKVAEVKKDDIGETYVKFVQVIKGTKVKNSLINVHFDKNGNIVSVNGKFQKNKIIEAMGNNIISESDAIEIAKKQYTYYSLRNTPKT